MTDGVFQEGLQRLASRWEKAGRGLINRRLEGALGMNFLFECPGAAAKILRFDHDTVTMEQPQSDVQPHAVFSMALDDWKKVFSGEWSVMTVVLGGRTGFPKHHRRSIMQLSMMMQALFLLDES